jgi:hypothetical protein
MAAAAEEPTTVAGVPPNRYLNPFFSDETEEAEAKQWLVPDNAPLLSILVLKDGKKEKTLRMNAASSHVASVSGRFIQ